MTPQVNIEIIKLIIKGNRNEINCAMENGYGESDYIQFIKDKTEALSDMLEVYEEYWED